jgi:manganese/zinc/iron transport system substrate-binding protein
MMNKCANPSHRLRGRTWIRRLLLISSLALFVAPTFAAAAPPARAVVTIGMLADLVRIVGGDRLQVEQLIGSGVDPHLYKPSRNDVVQLHNADLIFYHGLLLEGKMTGVLDRMQRRGIPVVAVADTLLARGVTALSDDQGDRDPHLWMDVRLWMEATRLITDTLQAWDPAHAADYAARAAAYLDQLAALNARARALIATIPADQRILITAHDAFGYFSRAYNIEVHGIQGLSTESEAGLSQIESLVTLLVDRNLPAVFVESSISDKNVRALIEGAAARGHTVALGGTLYADAMGPADSAAGTYLGMIEHNITTITRALGGRVTPPPAQASPAASPAASPTPPES